MGRQCLRRVYVRFVCIVYSCDPCATYVYIHVGKRKINLDHFGNGVYHSEKYPFMVFLGMVSIVATLYN